jgi:hypothetical protein
MVASDYRYGVFLWLGVMMSAFGLLAIGSWALDGFKSLDASASLLPLLFLAEGMLLLLMGWRFKAFNRRRQAAAGGDPSVPLAAEQPIPNEEALALPITVRLTGWRGRSLAVGGVVGLAFLLLTFWLPFINGPIGQGQTGSTFVIVLSLFSFGFALGFAILVSVHFMRQYCEITATAEGLTIQQRQITYHIPWHEARLFAITRGIKRTGSPVFYELSSAATFAPLIRLRRNTLFPSNLKPALPFDEYERQREALLSVIAAKTGLPLYDLR